MPMNYAYHPGNVAHSSAQEVDDTVFPAAKTLGINLIPLEGATSCGAGIIRQANRRCQKRGLVSGRRRSRPLVPRMRAQ